MKRRCFLATGLGAVVAGAAADGMLIAAEPAGQAAPAAGNGGVALHPRDTKLCVKPVMTNVIHSAAWQGPCRPTSVAPEVEKAGAAKRFADWCQQLKTNGLGRAEDVRLLEPAHVTFSEDWVIKPDQIAKLAPDSGETDVYFIIAVGQRALVRTRSATCSPSRSCWTASTAGTSASPATPWPKGTRSLSRARTWT